MDTKLVSTVLKVNDLIDDFIDLQEAQQVTIRKILGCLQDYQKNLDELYEKMYGHPLR